jgi:hypothetical protein
MKKSLEKKIEKNLGREIVKEVREEVDRAVEKQAEQVDKDVEKRVKEQVDREVGEVKKSLERKFHIKFYHKTRDSAFAFSDEFKKQSVIAITAVFAFLIALSWRTPIQNLIDYWINRLGLSGKYLYIEFLSAFLITIICVLGLMWVSKWNTQK